MLSVAHHPETPGSASKHSTLGHTWNDSKASSLKRRRTESDSVIEKKKALNSVSNLSEKFNNFINSSEITLTLIPKSKNTNQVSRTDNSKSKTSVIQKNVLSKIFSNDEKSSEKKDIPTKFLSLIQNYEEIELTKVDSHNSKATSSNNSNVSHSITDDLKLEKNDSTEETSSFFNPSLNELSEITIEPCTSSQKVKKENSPSTSAIEDDKKLTKSEQRLAEAENLLKKRNYKEKSPFHKLYTKKAHDFESSKKTNNESEFKFDNPRAKKKIYNGLTLQDNSSTVDEDFNSELDSELRSVPASTSSGSEHSDFDHVGTTVCNRLYSKNKERPYYTIGLPNPPLENRCWANATFQVLFALPPINNIHNLQDVNRCSMLLKHLINIQTIWRSGDPRNSYYVNCFNSFKSEVSNLDGRYGSTDQQDVTEFLFLLLNTLKQELGKNTSDTSSSNEIENIPNNEQDTLPRTQSNLQDSNKRLPLTEISAVTRPLRNSHPGAYSTQDCSSFKSSSTSNKSRNENQNEINSNPIDDYFSFSEEEYFTCEGCSKERVKTQNENLTIFVDLPSEDNGILVNLKDLIIGSYADENREIICESCKHEVQKVVKKLKKPPKILIASIKRYNYNLTKNEQRKNKTLIEIPSILELDSLIVNSPDLDHYPRYEAIGIISHISDEPCRGHYVSCVKHGDEWFHYDDEHVKLLSAEEVFQCTQDNSYLIFFRDIEPSRNTDTTNDQLNNKESIIC